MTRKKKSSGVKMARGTEKASKVERSSRLDRRADIGMLAIIRCMKKKRFRRARCSSEERAGDLSLIYRVKRSESNSSMNSLITAR